MIIAAPYFRGRGRAGGGKYPVAVESESSIVGQYECTDDSRKTIAGLWDGPKYINI